MAAATTIATTKNVFERPAEDDLTDEGRRKLEKAEQKRREANMECTRRAAASELENFDEQSMWAEVNQRLAAAQKRYDEWKSPERELAECKRAASVVEMEIDGAKHRLAKTCFRNMNTELTQEIERYRRIVSRCESELQKRCHNVPQKEMKNFLAIRDRVYQFVGHTSRMHLEPDPLSIIKSNLAELVKMGFVVGD